MMISRVDQLPRGEHWAILRNTSVSIPGDERSRTNPGHGYPASTEYYLTYEAFTDEALFRKTLERELSCRHHGVLTVRGVHVTETFTGQTVITAVTE